MKTECSQLKRRRRRQTAWSVDSRPDAPIPCCLCLPSVQWSTHEKMGNLSIQVITQLPDACVVRAGRIAILIDYVFGFEQTLGNSCSRILCLLVGRNSPALGISQSQHHGIPIPQGWGIPWCWCWEITRGLGIPAYKQTKYPTSYLY